MRVCLLLTLLVLSLSASSWADIAWFNDPTNRIANRDGVSPLSGDTLGFPNQDGGISCFAQLIWAGDDDEIDLAQASGNGVTGDDEVYAVGFIAQSTWINGYMTAPVFALGDTGADNYFYVRCWSTNSPGYSGTTSDDVPTGANVFYGNSALWEYAYDANNPSQFNFGGSGDANDIGWATTLTAIPEPSAFVLAFLGFLGFRFYRRRRP